MVYDARLPGAGLMFTVGQVDLILMLGLGLTSSVHCTTMCGPLLAVATAPVTIGRGGNPFRPKTLLHYHLSYHLGRVATYAVLGALLAILGSAVTRIPHAEFIGGVVQVTIGLGIAVAGIWQLVKGRNVAAASEGWLTRALRKVMVDGQAKGMLGMGILTGLLPCGVLYVAFSRAVLAGSAVGGALVMMAFWLGTVPLLASVGIASGGVIRLLGRYVTHLLFISMVTTGGWIAHKGIRNIMAGDSPPSASPAMPDDCPCHRGPH